MGRQIQICTTDSDNRTFEEYLNSSFDCEFYQTSAPTPDEIRIQDFAKTSFQFSKKILIHNKKFDWKPEFQQKRTEAGNYYLSNETNAPIIEFIKTYWRTKNSHGRVYWAKCFPSDTLGYDVEELSIFYDTIVKWFKKNCVGKVKFGNTNVYYLAGAWEKYKEFQEGLV